MLLQGIVRGYVLHTDDGPTTIERVRAFILENKWTFARTMPWCPHEYVVRAKCTSEAEFVRVVIYIRENGEPRRYGNNIRTYLDLDGQTMWTMGDPLNETTVLNRQRTDIAAKFNKPV
jgi:hypothetical protein